MSITPQHQYRGRVIERLPNDRVRVRMNDGHEFECRYDEMVLKALAEGHRRYPGRYSEAAVDI